MIIRRRALPSFFLVLALAVGQTVLPSFSGMIRAIDAKMLTLERPDANTLEFHCSRKTKYYDGSKRIQRSALKPGDHVSVEASEAPDGSLDAVNVHLERPKP